MFSYNCFFEFEKFSGGDEMSKNELIKRDFEDGLSKINTNNKITVKSNGNSTELAKKKDGNIISTNETKAYIETPEGNSPNIEISEIIVNSKDKRTGGTIGGKLLNLHIENDKKQFDVVMRNFKKNSYGITSELRKREAYVKPSVKRKLKSQEARKREAKFRRKNYGSK
ncbi:MAG: 30S ribosomal protein S21 [Candidatus Improbicoccus devescovinae]|nr:MAG: 30S ribosomal protein S21 [Candidatus Improbicoccus devescovinae]